MSQNMKEKLLDINLMIKKQCKGLKKHLIELILQLYLQKNLLLR